MANDISELIDTSNPEVRDYLSLIRLQVLTPLSVLINIVTVLICTFVVNPSIGRVTAQHPTSISPNIAVVAIYVLVLYVGQIGYCILLVLARKEDTKKALVKAVGHPLVFANWLMAFWAIAWVMQWFLVSTVLLGILLLMLIYSNLALLVYHPPTKDRPLDTLLIHAPLRFFLVLPLVLMFPNALFVTLGLTYDPAHPEQYSMHPWSGFGVVFGANLIAWLVVLTRRDIVLTVAGTWICAAIWSARPKPVPVYVTVIIFTVLHPLGLFCALVHHHFMSKRRSRQNGDIALPPDAEEGHAPAYASHHQQYEQERAAREQRLQSSGAREIDPDQIFGSG
ncbi:hypothetical protein CONPUDRAFT_122156 [Coniophora puteana RWD-64-598 SS2]|uniref:Uncharacterized protein n=1 Tax=Coniophora puteana (strain RWD-64-598) TaxID=741705 RepID=A0A5M3MT17_CONPW|nr:uncharacterized protein CONPUDRAFT_122156 [Coniophora puteana RWD-64-598 SS2]EIW81671.1 hypothetical protein CONPUDRAFT_122156 [Coniophora puteana RWD-64-598 SS2]